MLLLLAIAIGVLIWFLLNFLPAILILCTFRKVGPMRFVLAGATSILGWATFTLHTYKDNMIPATIWAASAWLIYLLFLFTTRHRAPSTFRKTKDFAVVCISPFLMYAITTFADQVDAYDKNVLSQQAPALPVILRNITASSGYSSACPPRNDQEKEMMEKLGSGVSPELNQRLHDQFPPGSDARVLAAYLTKEGFKPAASCENEATIQHATFFQKGYGPLPYSTNANVYWKTNADSQIVWTKGFIHYEGL